MMQEVSILIHGHDRPFVTNMCKKSLNEYIYSWCKCLVVLIRGGGCKGGAVGMDGTLGNTCAPFNRYKQKHQRVKYSP